MIEGRDIGTVVAPQAQVKVYLVADASVRAARRSSERPGIGADALATDLRVRDEKDAINMRPAEDAIQIDTTALDVDEVVARIEELVHARQTREDGMNASRRRLGRRPPDHRLARAAADAAAELRRGARTATGGVVFAFNHFHWIDPPVFGLFVATARCTSSPRSRPIACPGSDS